MNRFKNAKIYIIKNSVDDRVYIGSTCQRALTDRLWKHSSSSMDPKANGYNCALYQHMREVGQFEFTMELVEAYPCATKRVPGSSRKGVRFARSPAERGSLAEHQT